jgi:hypothetical protein
MGGRVLDDLRADISALAEPCEKSDALRQAGAPLNTMDV